MSFIYNNTNVNIAYNNFNFNFPTSYSLSSGDNFWGGGDSKTNHGLHLASCRIFQLRIVFSIVNTLRRSLLYCCMLSSYRRILRRIIRSAQSAYHESILTRRPSSSKQAWSVINTRVKGKEETQSPPVTNVSYLGLIYSDYHVVGNCKY